jgi:hypothetical protein
MSRLPASLSTTGLASQWLTVSESSHFGQQRLAADEKISQQDSRGQLSTLLTMIKQIQIQLGGWDEIAFD